MIDLEEDIVNYPVIASFKEGFEIGVLGFGE